MFQSVRQSALGLMASIKFPDIPMTPMEAGSSTSAETPSAIDAFLPNAGHHGVDADNEKGLNPRPRFKGAKHLDRNRGSFNATVGDVFEQDVAIFEKPRHKEKSRDQGQSSCWRDDGKY